MVLSNKKLKQRLRAELSKSVAKLSVSDDAVCNSTIPETPKSLKHLLDSATPKPRLSKREKRRKTLSLQTPDVENESNGEIKAAHIEVEGNGREKKRRREKKDSEESLKEEKRSKENGGGDAELGVIEDGSDLNREVNASKKSNKKKKHKKKKKKKSEKQEDKQSELDNDKGAVVEQSVAEKVDYSNSQGNDEDTKKVYVGGIPYYSTEDDIRSYFDHCGTITDLDCMTFPESGKFRGIAIISFKTDAAAKRALALDGSDMGGLYLKIQPYKTTRATKKTSDFCPPVVEGYNRIYAGNLSWDITEDDLRKFFSDCNISSIRFGEDKETGEFKGYAHVDFADNASLTKALKLDQKIVCGRPVRIRCAVPKKGGERNLGSAVPTVVKAETQNAVVKAERPETQDAVVKVEAANTSGVSSGKLRRRTCYECGEKGHISSDCPKKQAAEQGNASAS